MGASQQMHKKKYIGRRLKAEHRCMDCNKCLGSNAKKTAIRCEKCCNINNAILITKRRNNGRF